MMPEFKTWEDNGRFGLSVTQRAFDPDDDSIGRGGGTAIYSFRSEEARAYFIKAETWRDKARLARSELLLMHHSLMDCFTRTGRVRRKRLKALIEEVKTWQPRFEV